jgi:thiol:disulfide interchange protein DsbD
MSSCARTRAVWILLGLAWAAPLAAASLTATARSKHTTATLVPEHDALEPGRPLTIGLHLKMEPEWHTYWKNPGDSGLPTKIEWRLPEGFRAGPIEWPRPTRLPAGPLMSYAYEHEVLLLTRIDVPETLPAGETKIGALVKWLECKEACLPGKAELEIALPNAKGGAAPLAQWASSFAKSRAQLPEKAPQLSLEAIAGGPALALSVGGLVDPREAYFFPAAAEVIDHAAPQEVEIAGTAVRLRLARAANAPLPTTIAGVLQVDGRAYEIEGPVKEGVVPAIASTAGPAVGGSAGSLPIALLFAFIGGLILNLMPCVLPVLGLKVLGFVQSAGDSRRRALQHGLAFAGGVVGFFWLLAGTLLVLRAGGEEIGWGFQLQSPGFVVFLSALFLLVALNLFGVFEVGYSLTAAGNLAPRSGGLSSSFASGALATIVATPCTAPFMGSALGFALSQPAWSTLLVFTALGAGMAAPYVVLAASPALLDRLPRPGAWMETFKQVMGFPMLATVVFLLWLFGRQLGVSAMAVLLASLLLVTMGAWIYGRSAARTGTASLGAVALAGLLVIAGVALGFVQAQAAPADSGKPHAGGVWEPYSASRLAELRAAGTPVFLDFTADWCLTCQVNERVALDRDEVQARFRAEGVVLMKADWTRHDDAITQALAGYGRQGVPVYVLYGRTPGAPPRLLPEVLTPGLVLSTLDEVF